MNLKSTFAGLVTKSPLPFGQSLFQKKPTTGDRPLAQIMGVNTNQTTIGGVFTPPRLTNWLVDEYGVMRNINRQELGEQRAGGVHGAPAAPKEFQEQRAGGWFGGGGLGAGGGKQRLGNGEEAMRAM